MTPEKHRAHALLARQLIRACGGLAEAAGACRLEKSRLQQFTDPMTGALTPLDVIEDLQEYCGSKLYFEGLAAMLPCAGGEVGLRDESCSLTEAAVAIQADIRRALADGVLSPAEKREVEILIQAAERHLRCLRSAAERGRP